MTTRNSKTQTPSSVAGQESDLLAKRIAELPRELEPSPDLWPSIAARLGERAEQSPEAGEASAAAAGVPASLANRARAWLRSFQAPAWGWQGWALQAGAALLFLTAGAGLGRLSAPSAVPTAEPPRGLAEIVEPATVASSMGVDSSAVSSAYLRVIEADYLRAKDALWLAAFGSRQQLRPETLEIVERNLRILDQAIGELRAALAADPGNRQLEDLLVEQHRKELRLLQRLAQEPANV